MRFTIALQCLLLLSIAYARVPLGKSPRHQVFGAAPPANVSTATVTISIFEPLGFPTLLTQFTPSPGAPITGITTQSQIVTSYVPQLTACPLAFNSTPYYEKRQVPRTTPPQNSSNTIIIPFFPFPIPTRTTGPCSTLYSPTVTQICYSAITPLGGVPITVTDCTQKIAFSTTRGLYGPANGTAEDVATTYFANWNRVVTGVPLGLVDAVLCPQTSSCTTITESWYTEVVETTTINTSSINVNVALSGPQEVLIPPYFTFTITGTALATLSLSTTVDIPAITQSTLLIQETLTTRPVTPSITSLPKPTIPITTPSFPGSTLSARSTYTSPASSPPSTITLTSTFTKTKTLTLTLQSGTASTLPLPGPPPGGPGPLASPSAVPFPSEAAPL